MPRTGSSTSLQIEVSEEPRELPRPEPDTPFRILVAGNFSGGAGPGRRPIEIDRDNFEEVLERIAPEVRIALGGSEHLLKFQELDDFHPDRIFGRLEPFRALRDLRERLEDPATFRAAAAEMAPERPSMPEASNLSDADVLRQMMGESPQPSAAAPARSAWDRMLHELVSPYAEAKPDPRQPALIAQVDAAITGQMRGVLHNRGFQALESAWRGMFFLIRRLETGENLKVYLMDTPPAGLPAAVEDADDSWAVIAGLYGFGPEDEPALSALAVMARNARAPFLAGLAPDVVGLTRVFETLRKSGDARWIGLAMPRFLLRLPYGKNTDSIDTFAFEEMPEAPEHERYLWGNPAIACAYLLGEAFSRYGWELQPGVVRDIEGLPLHVYPRDGEPESKPCAEILLTERAAELLLDRGFMPLVWIKGTDRVRLVRFQSIAETGAALAGRWAAY